MRLFGIPFVLLVAIALLSGCDTVRGYVSPEKAELKKAHLKFREAITARDMAALFEASASPLDVGFAPGLEAVRLYALMESGLPEDFKVAKALFNGNRALLVLQAQSNGRPMTGFVDLVKEKGGWKVEDEAWRFGKPGGRVRELGLQGGEKAPPFEHMDPSNMPPVYGVRAPSIPPVGGKTIIPARTIYGAHDDEVTGLEFTPDGGKLVSIGYGDYTARMFDVADGSQLDMIKFEHRPKGVDITPDGTLAVITTLYDKIVFLPIFGRKFGPPYVVETKIGGHTKLDVSPRGDLLAIAGYDNLITLWSIRDTRAIARIITPEHMRDVAFSPSGRGLAASSATNKFTFWDLTKGTGRTYTVPKVGENSDPYSIDFSQDGRYFATGHADSTITVWDAAKPEQMHDFWVPNAGTIDVRFNPDDTLLATAQQDKIIYLWDPESSNKETYLAGAHSKPPQAIAFSPDGTFVASGDEAGKIVLWRLAQ